MKCTVLPGFGDPWGCTLCVPLVHTPSSSPTLDQANAWIGLPLGPLLDLVTINSLVLTRCWFCISSHWSVRFTFGVFRFPILGQLVDRERACASPQHCSHTVPMSQSSGFCAFSFFWNCPYGVFSLQPALKEGKIQRKGGTELTAQRKGQPYSTATQGRYTVPGVVF